jgi:hypothetical protein
MADQIVTLSGALKRASGGRLVAEINFADLFDRISGKQVAGVGDTIGIGDGEYVLRGVGSRFKRGRYSLVYLYLDEASPTVAVTTDPAPAAPVSNLIEVRYGECYPDPTGGHDTFRHHRHGVLTVVSTRSQYFREDGMSFGVGDERGHVYTLMCRPATEEEVQAVVARETATETRSAAERARREIANEIRERGQRPDGVVVPEHEDGATRVMDRQSIYGGGDWFVVTSSRIWYVLNNGRDGDDWGLNNVRTGGAGAIGWYVERTDELVGRLDSVSNTLEGVTS